jgi:hypothetical protein
MYAVEDQDEACPDVKDLMGKIEKIHVPIWEI